MQLHGRLDLEVQFHLLEVGADDGQQVFTPDAQVGEESGAIGRREAAVDVAIGVAKAVSQGHYPNNGVAGGIESGDGDTNGNGGGFWSHFDQEAVRWAACKGVCAALMARMLASAKPAVV